MTPGTALASGRPIVQLVLPSVPGSVRVARGHVRAALDLCQLGGYADDAVMITSELITNAVQHTARDPAEPVSVTLARVRDPEAVAVMVSDSSPEGPVLREAPLGSERCRGLRIVDALSACWGWHPRLGGKTVFAVITASAEDLAATTLDAAIAAHEAWETAGRPGGTIPHDAVAAELLGHSG